MARPKKPAGEAKTFVIPVRFTEEQRKQIKTAAAHEHLEVSGWLRKVALDAATTVNKRAATTSAVRVEPAHVSGPRMRRLKIDHLG